MNTTSEILFLAFALFVAIVIIDVVVAPGIPWGVLTSIYWLGLYGCWLVFFPTYMAAKSSLRDGAKLLGFSLLLWSIEDPLYYLSRGYPAFSPFPEHSGMYPLMVYWWPIWFLILSRLSAGLITLAYVSMNPDWGEDRLRIPSFSRGETIWILKVAAAICVGCIIFSAWYLYYSRAGFGGEILWEIDRSYKKELSPETVYQGILVKKRVEGPSPASWDDPTGDRYVLDRSGLNLNLSDLVLARPSPILDSYLYREVEILGKLVDRHYRRELIVGRIREAKENG